MTLDFQRPNLSTEDVLPNCVSTLRRVRGVALLAAVSLPVWLVAVGAPGPPPPEPILLGTAVRPISPPLGVPLMGYPSPRPNTGVAMDLFARAAVFGQTNNSRPAAALVVLDILHIDRSLGRAVRERAAAVVPGLAPDTILVAATHTHSGPNVARAVDPSLESEQDRTVFEAVVAASAEAIAAAWNERSPVRARVGHAAIRLAANRRVVSYEGIATNEWKDPDGRHPGYCNPDVPFVVFEEAATGATHAVLFSYGCHPVVMGPKSTRVSPDYPGYAARAIERAVKASTAVFITGAAGDINPRDCLNDDQEHARAMGEALAAAVLATLPAARPISLTPVVSVSTPLRLNVKPEFEKPYAARLVDGLVGRIVISEVQALRLGDLALVSSPGELVSLLGVAVQNSSPFPETLIVYNANDHLGYLVSDAIRREGGYETRSAISTDIETPYLAAAHDALVRARAAGP